MVGFRKYESTLHNIGCLIGHKTSASSTSWWAGIWGANGSSFNIWYNYKGLSIKPTGDVSTGGANVDIGKDEPQSRANTYLFNHLGSAGYMQMEGRYRDQGCVHFGN